MTYSKKIIEFLKGLEINTPLPIGIKVMNPYKDDYVFSLCSQFYTKYYNDSLTRTLIVGINPGRFGGGLTGIPFTDPIKLEKECGIKNEMPKKAELSADFIYSVINAYGGKEKFYKKFYFSSICPLGFTRADKNLNYYDVKELQKRIYPFILQTLKTQLDFGLNTKVAYCLGEGQNFKFFKRLNEEYKIFQEIIPLAHPRFIMQYRRKKMNSYIEDYIAKLREPESFIP